MSFNINIAGLDELSDLHLSTDVTIDRRTYDHSVARVVLSWDVDHAPSEQNVVAFAAKAIGNTIDIEWKGYDLSETVDCFYGYVEQANGERVGNQSRLIVDCVSMSKRTDLVPRFRAFQACKLADICQQIAKSEPLIKIDSSADLDFDIPLSIQYDETDFSYLSRMLHAWGIPFAIDYKGNVVLGARGTVSSNDFPGPDFRWLSVTFVGSISYFSTRINSGGGPPSSARSQVDRFHGQLPDVAADYYPIDDATYIRPRLNAVKSQTDTSYYHLIFDGGVLPFASGDIVRFESQDTIVRQMNIHGDAYAATARQEFILQPFTLPYQPHREMPNWPSRCLWGWVTENQNDPSQSGRIQVKFDFEDLDPQLSSDKAWLPVLAPYGGGKSPSDGKAGSYNGFYSLPEVGERVLVEFIGEWDSEAIVLGSVRHSSVSPMFDPKDTKRWRLPSGTEVAMTSKGATEIVRLRCNDKIFFESKLEGSNAEVYLTPGESDGDIIHLKKGSGPPSINILCDGNITVISQQKLHLEGMQVQVKASGGNVNIDGAPNVMINCVPTPATPLQKQLFTEDTMSTSSVDRVLPSLQITGN